MDEIKVKIQGLLPNSVYIAIIHSQSTIQNII